MRKLKNAYVLDACIWPESGRFTGMSQDYKDSMLDACFLTLDGDSFRTGVESLGTVSLLTRDPKEKIRIASVVKDRWLPSIRLKPSCSFARDFPFSVI